MVVFRATEQALADLSSNEQLLMGEHLNGQIEAGAHGLMVGSVSFDPTKHRPHQIDPISPLGLALDQPFVREVLPLKALNLNIVVDATDRDEHPMVSMSKRALAGELVEAIDSALPGMTDKVFAYVIGDGIEDLGGLDYEPINVAESTDINGSVAALATYGLTFVVSDFKRLVPVERRDFVNVVAIKTDHKLERQLPAGIGPFTLRGGAAVNTDKRRELREANQRLEQQHQEIIARLKKMGASVASIVVDPKENPYYGFNFNAADQAIAEAIVSKHKH